MLTQSLKIFPTFIGHKVHRSPTIDSTSTQCTPTYSILLIRSLKVAVQGLNYMAHPLYIHTSLFSTPRSFKTSLPLSLFDQERNTRERRTFENPTSGYPDSNGYQGLFPRDQVVAVSSCPLAFIPQTKIRMRGILPPLSLRFFIACSLGTKTTSPFSLFVPEKCINFNALLSVTS
jgi:hypothetical protein